MQAAPDRHLTVWAIAALIIAAVSCGEKLSEVPRDLIGIWETEQGGYRGRILEIRQDVVRFGAGEGVADTYTVIGSTRGEADSGIAYTVVYEDSYTNQARLHVLYDPSARSLRLKNRPNVTWRRREAVQPQ